MEDVLEACERPSDSTCPVVEMDEQPVQLLVLAALCVDGIQPPPFGRFPKISHAESSVSGRTSNQ